MKSLNIIEPKIHQLECKRQGLYVDEKILS